MANETPSFLRLKLFSAGDDAGAIQTWRGLIGGQQPLLATVTMAYHARVAALAVGAQVAMDVHGQPRQFSLLSIEPAPDATCAAVVLHTLPTEAEPVPFFSNAYSHSLDFQVEASDSMVELQKSFQRSCCAQEVLHCTNSNVRFIPN